MDFDALRAGLQEAVPFNSHVGLEVVEIGDGRAVMRLPDADRLKNHVGSQHAGALFTAGEAASGAAFLGAFADRIGSLRPLTRSAEITYTKVANGPIIATATLRENRAALYSHLDAGGRVEFPVTVELADEHGDAVAEMVVHWHVRATGERG